MPTGSNGQSCKPQYKFLLILFSTNLIACGKINFTNLSRYSDLSEKTYRRQFEKPFDFAKFSAEVIKAAIAEDHIMIAVMDCSFIAKSGKSTFGLDHLYNGSHAQVEKGLEVSLVAVVNVEETGYALLAEQTFAQDYLPELTQMDYYLDHLQTVRPQMPEAVRYLLVDQFNCAGY